MARNYLRHADEDAQRRQTADAERQHDQQVRYERAVKEQWRREQDSRLAADAARRQRTENEQRRVHA